ncbi:hypothetical protein NQX30_00420 [Candidatus Persebacteraceae bacterium Df01]|uniref:Sigma-54 factor interaction domain-containing protein n=1 Tax=Candidatus Doriopsillibacter californiensis TaxID=2970740 RepID=A0ABT7QJG5_9GAMM|nr:hypothetical protein [Candidatus Persebacteraceae bacterium Df01]
MQNALDASNNERGNPNIIRTNFGKSAIIQKFKQQLLDASAGSQPALLVGTPSSGASFFAQLLAKPKMPVVFLDNSTQLEGAIENILREANGGILVIRLIDMLNSIQQSGLLALVRESGRMNVRLIAAAVNPPEKLKTDRGYNKALLNSFSNHVITMPSLTQYIEDIPYIVDIITRQLTEQTDMVGRRLSPQAVNLLTQHDYENDFMELLSLVRSALMYASGDKVDAATMQVIIEQFSLNSSLKGVRSEIFSMSMREARMCFEREYLRRIMHATRGNIQQAAEIAGIERTYLYRKLKQHKEV